MAAQLLNEIAWGWPRPSGDLGDQQRSSDVQGAARAIHALRIYSDIIGREIELERRKMVEKLAPFLIAKLPRAAAGETPELLPSEVRD